MHNLEAVTLLQVLQQLSGQSQKQNPVKWLLKREALKRTLDFYNLSLFTNKMISLGRGKKTLPQKVVDSAPV